MKKQKITLHGKSGYGVAFLGLLLAGSMFAYWMYRGSDHVAMERVYEDIARVQRSAATSSNPLRLSEDEKRIFVKLYPYKREGGDFLYSKLKSERNPYTKQVILKLLPWLGCTDCMNTLESYMKDDDEGTVTVVLTALHKLNPERAREVLYEIIEKNESERIVPWAVFLLSEGAGEADYTFISDLRTKPGYHSAPMQKAIGIATAQMQKNGLGPKTRDDRANGSPR